MIKYIFRDEDPIRIKGAGQANPQVIGEALAAIAEKHGGQLHAKDVLEEARSKQHPLNVHFEWNDSIAAEHYRVDQARNIIRIVRVEDDNSQDGTSRAFISINDGETAYRPLALVQRSADLQRALLRQAQKELDAFERRYRDLADICKIVREANEAIQRRIEKESRVAA